MRAIRLLAMRAFSPFVTSFGGAVLALFLAASAGRFAWMLRAGEGGSSPISAIWVLAAAPFLPVLAAALTMRTLAEERRSGALELLLSTPVREREIVVGKFLGSYIGVVLSIAFYLAVPALLSLFFDYKSGPASGSYSLAFLALALQAALWCAIGTACSACSTHAALAFVASVFVSEGIPYALHHAALAWLPSYRSSVPMYIPETHVYDMATGLVSSSAAIACLVWTGFALLFASKQIASLRFRHRGCHAIKISSFTAVVLAAVFAVLATVLARRLDVSVDIMQSDSDASVSPRLYSLLGNTRGDLRAVCYMPRRSPDYRSVSRLMRVMRNAARAAAGAEVQIEYVDPRWDLARSSRLTREGVKEGAIVLYSGRRREIAVANGGEDSLAAALQRLLVPQRERNICFVTGHGEADPESYDPVGGYSDVARELVRNGYTVSKVDLSPLPAVPSDCSVMVMAGPRAPLTRVEKEMVDSWLRHGGRLLYLAHRAAADFAPWGAVVSGESAVPVRTSSGEDTVISPSPDHPVTAPLAGGSVVLDMPLLVRPAAASAGGDASADRIVFTPLLSVRSNEVVAAALQRGVTAKDIALRPTRIVIVGSDSFVMNGALGEKGAANRDFILNAVSWLAGVDSASAASASPMQIHLGMDRGAYATFAAAAAVGLPLFVFMAFAFIGRRRLSRP